MYRPGEWEQLPSERDLNPFSRYEALDPKRPIVLDDIETGTGHVKTQRRPPRSHWVTVCKVSNQSTTKQDI